MKKYEDAFVTKNLKIHPDDRGFLMEILRNDDEIFKKFGQVYITCCEPGFVKAWHYHKVKTDYFTCIHGTARVVVYDDRDGSPTKGEAYATFQAASELVGENEKGQLGTLLAHIKDDWKTIHSDINARDVSSAVKKDV